MVELGSDLIGLPGRLVEGVDTKSFGNSEGQASPVEQPGQVPAVPKGAGHLCESKGKSRWETALLCFRMLLGST